MDAPPRIHIQRAALLCLFFVLCLSLGCKSRQHIENIDAGKDEFPKELVLFSPDAANPVFTGTGGDTWDRSIRERGFILYEDHMYKMWYTGYRGAVADPKALGYATSADGIRWERYAGNPVFSEKWTEDMFVFRHEEKFYMVAEGMNDVAHLLSGDDGIRWQEMGDLVILTTTGDTIPGPYGTPSVWIENGRWHLFYERNDEGVWLAISEDRLTWRNLQDEPVLKKGPSAYDAGAVAANQVIRYGDRYFMYYHGSSDPDWNKPEAASLWSSNVAMSRDLVHWVKYPGNPIVAGDHSSPIVVSHEGSYQLFTMHNEVCKYISK